MNHQVIAIASAFCLALAITPLFRRIAIWSGLVDKPDQRRKLHGTVVALSGGVAVLLSLTVACGLALLASSSVRQAVLSRPWPVIGLGVSSVGMVLLGLLDDAIGIRGRQKLAGQVLLVSFLVWSGFRLEQLSLFGWQPEFGLFVIPISIGWLLLTVNALNLIDGADGLCSTVGWIASAGLAFMAAVGGHSVESTIAAGLAGALLGFLVFNFPPARIFLGDAGSMLIGLLLGALALRTSLKGATAISLFGPVSILAIPIFDSGMAILRRKLTGRSVFTVDRGHLHHNLLRTGLGQRGVVFAFTALCSVTAIGALTASLMNNELIALCSILVVVGTLIASRVFGYAELHLLSKRLRGFGTSLLSRGVRRSGEPTQQLVRFQGSRDWDLIWGVVTEFAERQGLGKVCLDLNVPWLHEGFHATWVRRAQLGDSDHRFQTKLPISSEGRVIGRLEMSGCSEHLDVPMAIGNLAALLDDLQPSIDRLCIETSMLSQPPADTTASVSMPATTSIVD